MASSCSWACQQNLNATPHAVNHSSTRAGTLVDQRWENDGVNHGRARHPAIAGVLWSVVAVAVVAALLLPLRAHLSAATIALVLVVPVVVGVARGGFVAGLAATVCGFLVYDLVFVKPYYTLRVGAAEDWAALGVYLVVMVLVARVVAQVDRARSDAQARAAQVRRLFDLSELLVREAPMPDLLERIVTTALQAFDLEGAALLLPVGGRLSLVASAGQPISEQELERLAADVPGPVSMEAAVVGRGEIQVLALAASGEAIGLLALRGLAVGRDQLDLLRAFTNHLALALERGQLREQVVRAHLLEEVDRLRRSLVGAVSHDLRSPLATIKVSTSTLLETGSELSPDDVRELAGLVDVQADRLDRLVANLLDMTRIQSGTLELRRSEASLDQLIDDAVSVLGSSSDLARLHRQIPADLPGADADPVLVCQVLANLIDNALRYAPDGTPVTVSARRGHDRKLEVSVRDRGPGVALEERVSIFEMVNRREAGGRGGLGLAIAKAFVEAHGERIWVESAPGGGARFVFTLPVAPPPVSAAGVGARRASGAGDAAGPALRPARVAAAESQRGLEVSYEH